MAEYLLSAGERGTVVVTFILVSLRMIPTTENTQILKTKHGHNFIQENPVNVWSEYVNLITGEPCTNIKLAYIAKTPRQQPLYRKPQQMNKCTTMPESLLNNLHSCRFMAAKHGQCQ